MTKKKKFRIKKFGLLFLLIVIGITSLFLVPKILKKTLVIVKKDMYLASDALTVKLYDVETFKEVKEQVRGTKIVLYDKDIKKEEEGKDPIIYKKIQLDKKFYLVKPTNLVKLLNETVMEKTGFVRTNLTTYKTSTEIDIDSYLTKGTKIDITGFDSLNKDGSVRMYKIKDGDHESFLYSKYIVFSQEEANKHYDEAGLYQIHAARTDTLGGGSGDNLDYYPNPKPNFPKNKFLADAKTLYLNCGVLNNVDAYIELAKNTGINSFVVDVKENTVPAYPSAVMEKYSSTSFNKAANTKENFGNAIKKLKDAGFYVIGRITTFKDSYYITDHPEDAITSTSSGKPFLHNGSYWPSPFVRTVWEYNTKLAVEAVKEFGFNEIQFDYMRFPDRSYTIEVNGLVDMKNKFKETKAQALQTFMMYATDEIHNAGAYVSVDVFGESSNTYITAYGQYWPAISNVVDAISAMPYPDHFDAGQYGLATPWTKPYILFSKWALEASNRQKEIPTPAVARTWIQAYNAIKPPYNTYGPEEIKAQITGLKDGGLTGGFITWNSSSNIEKYKSISTGW
ncbi:MAG: putative glycoside hydrolase [Bacilli bacterium]